MSNAIFILPHSYFQSWSEDAIWTVQHNVFIAVLTKFIVSASYTDLVSTELYLFRG